MEEADGIGESVLDQHALGIASEQLSGRGMLVIGEQNGRLVMAEVFDEELAEVALSGSDGLLEDAWRAVLALRQVESDGALGEERQGFDLGEESSVAPAQGDEGDSVLVETVEPVEGGELGVEYEMAGRAAVIAGPEVDEAEHRIGLFAFADVGVGVAENVAVGVLGEKDEYSRLPAAAHGQIVGLDLGMLAEEGDGVEVEIEGLSRTQCVAGDAGMLGIEQASDLLRGDAR